MDCGLLSAVQLRRYVCVLCFGCVFLWTLSGRYLEEGDSQPWHSTSSNGLAVAAQRQTNPTSMLQKSRTERRLLLSGAADSQRRRLLLHQLSSADRDTSSDSGGSSADSTPCSDVHKQNSSSSRCEYVRTTENCQNDEGLFVYLDFIYCRIPYRLIPLAMVILFLWLIFLFIFLGATAEEYFCPALKVMSDALHLSQNVAGVTLLALGNGAPDIFSAFAAISQTDDHKSSLAIGALFGAGIFVTSIVVGGVAFLKAFTLTKRPFLRDIIFYTIAVYATFYLLWTGKVTIYMAAGFIGLYVVYVVIVIVGRLVHQRLKREKQSDTAPAAGSEHQPSPHQPRRIGVLPTLLLPPSPLTTSFKDGDLVTYADEKEKSDAFTSEGERTDRGEGESRENSMRHYTRSFSVGNSTDHETESEAHVYPVHAPTVAQGGSLQLAQENDVSEKQQHSQLPPSPLPPPSHTQKLSNKRRKFTASPLFSQLGDLLTPPLGRRQRSITPTPYQDRGWRYRQRRQMPNWRDEERTRSATPTPRKLIKKSLSGALDVSEEVVAAVGLPHVPQMWEEIQRVHQYRKSPLTTRRSRQNSWREGSQRISDHSQEESQRGSHHSEQEQEEEDETNEDTPIIAKQPKRPHPFIALLWALCPFGEDFRQLGILGKVYEIVKIPCGVILTLTVPVIDHDVELHNWNRWLNIIHCVTGPMIIALLTKRGFYMFGGVFPAWTLVLIVSVLVAIAVACTSRNDKQPVYHCVFAWLGFAIAVVWIYIIANEIVNLLLAFGVVVKLSDGILGITLLAWGNSIGDAVANMTMARQGFPRMAIGACYGGPLLNMLIGIGAASLYKTIQRKADGFQFNLYFTQVEFFAAVFLMATLALSMATITFSRFRIYRPLAVFLVVFYFTFLTVAILAEIPAFTISISDVFYRG